MRNLDIVNEDRISQLPEALILHILCLLPTKEFTSRSCKSLLSHKAPILESLHLEVDLDTCSAMDIGILLGIAFGRNVRELLLDVYHEKKKKRSFSFPPSLYTCETLETLILRFLVLVNVPSQICLKSLKTLHLDYMDYKDDTSVPNLLSGCPCLETLVVRRFSYGGYMKTFTIAVPSLQSLSIYDEYYDGVHRSYVINASCLKYLHIDVKKCLKFCLTENSPELVKAHISCETINEKRLRSLTSVKMLTLLLGSPLEVTYPIGSIFYRLVYLELYTSKPAWWNLLTLMLDISPKLKVFKLLINVSICKFFPAQLRI